MPYPNFHAAQMKSAAKKYIRTRYKKITAGVFAVIGVLSAAKKGVKGGRTEIQSYRFDRKKFTAEAARKWLKDHKLSPKKFEKATDKGKGGKNEAVHPEELKMLLEVALDEQTCPKKKKKKKRKTESTATAIDDIEEDLRTFLSGCIAGGAKGKKKKKGKKAKYASMQARKAG